MFKRRFTGKQGDSGEIISVYPNKNYSFEFYYRDDTTQITDPKKRPMKKLCTMLFLLSLVKGTTAQTTYVNNGTATNYSFSAGDSLYIASGTYTGSISSWVANTKITVAPGAEFRPSSINGYRSIYRIYGSATLPNAGAAEGFQLYNYGITTFTGTTQTNSTAIYYNHQDATLTFTGDFSNWSNNTSFQNNGNISVAGNFAFGGNGVILQNNGNISITGNFSGNSGQINSHGLLHVGGSFTLNSPVSFNNSCRVIVENGITLNNNTVYNSGLLWASSARNNGNFTNNNATVMNSGNAVLRTRTFTNNGHIRGNGSLYILGSSVQNGSVGSNVATEELFVYTVNRASTDRIFDNQWGGTVYPNAQFSAINEPDTTIIPMAEGGCSFTYAPFSILPVQWKSFDVSLVNNVPSLSWSILSDEKLVFEVERSTNGKEFTLVSTVEKTSYRDMTAGESATLYYRVKAISPDGTQKYSDIKMVKLTNAPGISLQAFPNPFVQQLNIRYNATEKSAITLSIYHQSGQLQYRKKVMVEKGSNLFEITEAANWKPGIYLVQFITEKGDSRSSTIMKQ